MTPTKLLYPRARAREIDNSQFRTGEVVSSLDIHNSERGVTVSSDTLSI